MADPDNGSTPDPQPATDAGDVPISAEGANPVGGGLGNVPVAGEGSTWSQKSANDAIGGETTQHLREGEVRAERTVDLPLSEDD
jgi:hypothetical protein